MAKNSGFDQAEYIYARIIVSSCNPACIRCLDGVPGGCMECKNYWLMDEYDQEMFSQESEICVYFKSYSLTTKCQDCHWKIEFTMVPVVGWEDHYINFNHSLNIFYTWRTLTAYTFFSNESMKLFFAMDQYNVMRYSLSTSFFYIFDSLNLMNLVGVEYYDGLVGGHEYVFPNGTVTIFYSGKLETNDTGDVMAYLRSAEEEKRACTGPNLVFIEDTINVTIGAKNESCTLYALVTRGNSDYSFVQTLAIDNISYFGNSCVVVVAGYNSTYPLFAFNQSSSTYWSNEILYGPLISFMIPPQGQLNLNAEIKAYSAQVAHAFEGYTPAVFMSPFYPYDVTLQSLIDAQNTLLRTVLGSNGIFEINVTIVYAEIPNGTNLILYCGNSYRKFENETIKNGSVMFSNCTEFDLSFQILDGANGSTLWNGYLIEVEATPMNFHTNNKPVKHIRRLSS